MLDFVTVALLYILAAPPRDPAPPALSLPALRGLGEDKPEETATIAGQEGRGRVMHFPGHLAELFPPGHQRSPQEGTLCRDGGATSLEAACCRFPVVMMHVTS